MIAGSGVMGLVFATNIDDKALLGGASLGEGVGQVAVHDTGLDAARLGVGDGADRSGLPPAFRRVSARESASRKARGVSSGPSWPARK